MNYKKITLTAIFSLFVVFFCFSTIIAQEEEYVDPEIPESWYEAPKTASEMNITEYSQSPILKDEIDEGKLPSLEERLPDDPPIIEAYSGEGEYGGELNLWSDSIDSWWGSELSYVAPLPSAGRPSPDGQKMIPNYIKSWEFSNDFKDITLHLRKGMKWSDGQPVTADDYLYWWNHVANNEVLSPTPPEEWNPRLLNVSKNDKWSVTFHYDTPRPRVHQFQFQGNMGPEFGCIQPEHYMKDFHPDFVGEKELKNMAEEKGLEEWDELYNRILDDSPVHPEYEYIRPVLRPYVPVERSETSLVVRRNPYFPFIDGEGNQLPYIDKIRVNLANSPEMVTTKTATGEATFSGRIPQTGRIPMYKSMGEQENYRTLIYYRPYGSDTSIMPNLTHKDDRMREIFQNTKFRKALSLAIDREEVNRKLFFGEGTSRQVTVPPTSKYFKPEYAEAYADYDPERAKELLDEIDMVDANEDGFREGPDGEEFEATILYSLIGSTNPTEVLEMIRNDWQDINLDIDIKMVSRELRDQRITSNDHDITTWTSDVMLDITLGNLNHLGKYFAPTGSAAYSPWPAWINWYSTQGETGMEPPENIKELIEYGETWASSSDQKEQEEVADKLLKAQAENLWTIGTVGMAPTPVIVSNEMYNVPEKGLWDWGLRRTKAYYAEQFSLKE